MWQRWCKSKSVGYIYICVCVYIQYIGITRNVALFQSITFLRNASLFSHLFKTGEQKQQENAWPIEGLRVWFTIHGCVWSIHHWPWLRGLAHDDMTTSEVFGTAWSQHVSTISPMASTSNPLLPSPAESNDQRMSHQMLSKCSLCKSVPRRKF